MNAALFLEVLELGMWCVVCGVLKNILIGSLHSNQPQPLYRC